ncbi:hypothetical protein THIBAULT_104 [Mycobacterium phage Thibault]|uniref:Uncharacterized protein n=1 Tax=Mycobacterium phage Thibault TaxID=1052673 RepID=G1FGG9_9CAUD|nr:hypothetical protein CL87_gp104 [Mycobacterium phage Thibault]AEJ94027.1 hypothetical protein THIBAULT_104 [Mycobacterium phage Thibault]
MPDNQVDKFLTTWPGIVGGLISFDQPNAPSNLSSILETPGEHLRKYFLSAKACQGILRRAAKRGRKLPEPLEQALRAIANE